MKYLTIILLFLSFNSFAQTDTISSNEYMSKSGDELIAYNQKIKGSIGLGFGSLVLAVVPIDKDKVVAQQIISGVLGLGAIAIYLTAQKHIRKAGEYLKLAAVRMKD